MRSVTGYKIGAEGRQASRKALPTYWVCDREGWPKEVAVFAPVSVPGAMLTAKMQKRRADALCARLNVEYDEWLRSIA